MIRFPVNCQQQIEATYRRMAREAQYRPKAPGDGFGNISFPEAELDLDAEAKDYADAWWEEEDEGVFHVGACDFETRPATVFAVEGARLMCAGTSGRRLALRLLEMAAADLKALEAQ